MRKIAAGLLVLGLFRNGLEIASTIDPSHYLSLQLNARQAADRPAACPEGG